MKRLFGFGMLLIVAMIFSACGGTVLQLCEKNLSEVRYNVFSGETDTYTASFMTGKREKPYSVNGVSEKAVDFGLLTITFKGNDTPLTASYKLTINDTEKTGNLEYNQYDNNFMVDVGEIVGDDAKINVEITVGTTKSSIDLVCKNTDFEITWQTALNIGAKELEKNIKANTINGKLNGEIYIKIITDINGNFDDYFWYVSLYTKNGDNYAIIINPKTGEIMAQK